MIVLFFKFENTNTGILMKTLTKLVLIGAVSLFSINALAGTAQHNNEKTTCYVFKAGNLVKKSYCTYSGMTGANNYGGFGELDFTIKGYGKFSTVHSVYSSDGFDPNGSGRLIGEITEKITLNNAEARVRYRDINSFKTLTSNEADRRMDAWIEKGNARRWKNMGTPNYIKCYKQINTSLELCYIDNILS